MTITTLADWNDQKDSFSDDSVGEVEDALLRLAEDESSQNLENARKALSRLDIRINDLNLKLLAAQLSEEKGRQAL